MEQPVFILVTRNKHCQNKMILMMMDLDLTPLLNGWHYQNIINAVLTQVLCWYRILFGLQSTFWQYNNVGLYFIIENLWFPYQFHPLPMQILFLVLHLLFLYLFWKPRRHSQLSSTAPLTSLFILKTTLPPVLTYNWKQLRMLLQAFCKVFTSGVAT